MARRLLPIGIQTFRNLRKRNCYYVDKTPYALQLIDEGTHYFLSRPRRFGKSLFLDTLKALFEGRRELFQGLHAHGDWEWSVRHPVVRLDFSGGDFEERGYLHTNLMAQLDAIEEEAGIRTRYDTGPERLADLIRGRYRKSGRGVAVLVDEYDKPILDALEVPEIARANRNYLRGLYAVLKSCDAQIRFCMLTGVSRFSKVSLFSGLNNLIDITLEPAYSSICGYTESDLDDVFAAELEGLDRDCVRDWYNGYSWGASRRSTTRSTRCCCSASVRSTHGGSRPPRPRSWWRPSSSAAPRPRPWTAGSRARSCSAPSTLDASPRRRCCSRPATSRSEAKRTG